MLRVRLVPGFLLLIAATASAQPRVAVHPLDTRNLSPESAQALKAEFEVMLSRLEGIQLAGSARVEEALTKAPANWCEVRDSCLRFLAESSDAKYGLYAQVESRQGRMIARGRVVGVSGGVARNVTTAPRASAHEALVQLLRGLELEHLPADPGALPPPPLVVVDRRAGTARNLVGAGIVVAGGATLVAGGVFAGLSASALAANPPNGAGLVAPERAGRVAGALRQRDFAAVLIPAGAVAAVVGALVLAWPASDGTHVALGVSPGGVVVSGALP